MMGTVESALPAKSLPGGKVFGRDGGISAETYVLNAKKNRIEGGFDGKCTHF